MEKADHKSRNRNPFPELSAARQGFWGFVDHWAWNRLRRLCVPSPWAAYDRGYHQALIDAELRDLVSLRREFEEGQKEAEVQL